MPQRVFGGVGESREWLTKALSASPWLVKPGIACQELSFPRPWTLAVLLLDSPWNIKLPVSGRVKKKSLWIQREGMHLRTAQFLLYHAKVEGVVKDVSALSNLTDYSDKKFQDASLFCFRWRRQMTSFSHHGPTVTDRACTQYFYTALDFILLQAEHPNSDSTRSII